LTPLVLIPGMMCDARMWGGIDRDLGVPVLHHLPIQADSMSALAALFLAEAPQSFALAGLSLGGILAMEILRQSPDRVERLALLDTNPRAEVAEIQARRAPQIARALAGDLEGVMRDDMKPNYLAPGPDRPMVLDLCMDMAMALGPQVFARQSAALRGRIDQQTTLAAFKGPALVLMGAEDKLCPLDRHLLMHSLMPQSRLHIVPGAAHFPPLEQPDATARALRDWLA
jgi:pimeloyl-ACP methyl ester carboxylesterase